MMSDTSVVTASMTMKNPIYSSPSFFSQLRIWSISLPDTDVFPQKFARIISSESPYVLPSVSLIRVWSYCRLEKAGL